MQGSVFVLLAAGLMPILSPLQRPAFMPDLAALEDGKGLTVNNRNMSHRVEEKRNVIHLDDARGEGVAWFDGVGFSDGVIEFDTRGKNVLQKSFIGIAFHKSNDTTYDVVYFRPFNFQSEDSERRSHSVQYISHPDFGWSRLRKEHPGMYENTLTPAPNPDSWLHVRIVVANRQVTVFVKGLSEPCLKVDLLSKQETGGLGLWVGDESDGDFANVSVVPAG